MNNKIKHILFSVALFIICSSCGCLSDGLYDKIPDNEFKTFKYSRGGNVATANITATNCKKEGNVMTIEHIEFNESWPGFSLNVEIDGYQRTIKTE